MRHDIRFKLFRLPGGIVPHVDWIHMVISFRAFCSSGKMLSLPDFLGGVVQLVERTRRACLVAGLSPATAPHFYKEKPVTKKRDYKREYAQYHSKPEQKKNRAMRNTARRQAIAEYGKAALKGKDVDHIKPLSRGGTNAKSNRRIVSTHTNRARNLRSKRSS